MVRSPGYGIACFREPLATKAGLPTRMLEQVQRARGNAGNPKSKHQSGNSFARIAAIDPILCRIVDCPTVVPAFSHCQGNCDRRADAPSSFNSQKALSSSWKERPRSPLESVAERYFGLEYVDQTEAQNAA
jgi:hypothetical protein